MKIHEIKLGINHIWAKSPDLPGGEGLSLLEHTEQVIKQMGQYIKLYNCEINGVHDTDLPRIFLFAALIHDLGKIHPRFQAQLRNGSPFGLRHEVLSLAFMHYLEIPEKEFAYLAAAVALHHKEWRVLTEGTLRSPAYFSPHISLSAIKPLFELATEVEEDIIEKVILILESAGEVIFNASGFKIKPYPVKAGYLSLTDAMYQGLKKVYETCMSFEIQGGRGRPKVLNEQAIYKGVIIRGLMLSADHLASATTINLECGFESIEEVLKAIGRDYKDLRYHQQKIIERAGNQILIAPTGFGKTEAALLWAAKQREETGSRGRVFFLLPYRASMNAMAQRFKDNFGDSSTSLVHAKSLAKDVEKLIDEGLESQDAVKIARLKESIARLNSTPYRVCSPYQLIRSFFGTKGSEAIICSAIGSQLVFDEIHAYDPQVTAMALATAQYLYKMYNARILFMTATMPTHLLMLLRNVFPDIEEPVNIPEDILANISRHKLELVEGHVFSETAIEMIKEAAKGNSVLVVVNQVARAIKLFEILQNAGLNEIELLHSRFNVRDRARKEKLLTPKLGKILIATQVVEVSIDIDYDIGFFELAPLESLLQRFGRVNRKGNREWALVKVFKYFEDESPKAVLPYNSAHLEQVKKVLGYYLEDNPQGEIKENLIQKLLDTSYPQSLKDALVEELNIRIEEFRRYFILEYRPFGVKDNSSINELRKKWDDLFDGYEVLPEHFLTEAKVAESGFDVFKLMVSISGNQFRRLMYQGEIYKDDSLDEYIVKCDYDEEKGLLL